MTVSGPRRQRGEEGAALLAALIFVLICSVVVGVLLGFADTDFRTTVAVREQRREAYAADAAVEAAIRYYQANSKTCPASGWTAPSTNEVVSSDITVSCSADGGNAPSLTNAPQYAILTRGSASGDGIRAVSGALTPARGGVFVEGAIDVSSGARLYVVGGNVIAKGACSGTITTVSPPWTQTCGSAATVTDPTGITQAPAIPSAIPTARSVPSCPADGSPIVLQPGTYTDFTALKALTTSCSSSVFHFAADTGGPGFYYFNFSGGGDWTIGNGETIVGGTLTGPLASIASQPTGKKCDDTQQGVQFIFSGESRMSLASGALVELCPPLFDDDTTQRVSVYGPNVVAGTPVTSTHTAGSASGGSGTTTFTDPNNARTDDGNAAKAVVEDRKSATLTLSQFGLPTIPSGATVNDVKVTVDHKESATPSTATLSAKFEGGTGSSKTSTTVSSFTRSSSYVTETFNVTSTFDTAAELTDFQVALTADNPVNGADDYTQEIDVVSMSVTYTPAVTGTFPPTSGCVATGATCPLIKTQGQAVLTLKGTVYAPLGMLDIQLVGSTFQVFGRGVIVRRLDTDFTSSIDCNLDPLPDTEEYDSCYAFQLPRNRTLGDNVVFTATVRGRKLLRAYVNFTGSTPVMKQWSSINES
jgi:hypothetical protein